MNPPFLRLFAIGADILLRLGNALLALFVIQIKALAFVIDFHHAHTFLKYAQIFPGGNAVCLPYFYFGLFLGGPAGSFLFCLLCLFQFSFALCNGFRCGGCARCGCIAGSRRSGRTRSRAQYRCFHIGRRWLV